MHPYSSRRRDTQPSPPGPRAREATISGRGPSVETTLPPTAAWLLAILLPFSPPAARAHTIATPLGSLIDQATAVIVGTVTSVEPGTSPGEVEATITVEETLLGQPTTKLLLTGSTVDPLAPSFEPGARILALLAPGSGGSGLAPVKGAQGVFEIPDGSLDASRSIVTSYLAQDFNLAGLIIIVADTGHPADPQLIAATLAELQDRLTPADTPQIADIACDQTALYLPAVQLWAISMAGQLAVEQARPCLDALLADPVRATAVAASEALGDMGAKASAAGLLAALQGGSLAGASSLVLALGKLKDPAAVSPLADLASNGNDLGLHSTIVHSLGLIGNGPAFRALREIADHHPNELVRDQARRTVERLEAQSILFVDGFETGSASAWSTVVGAD